MPRLDLPPGLYWDLPWLHECPYCRAPTYAPCRSTIRRPGSPAIQWQRTYPLRWFHAGRIRLFEAARAAKLLGEVTR